VLPDAGSATIDLRKLHGYCLDATHPRGRHKARMFRAALGIGQGDAEWLLQAILAAVVGAEAQQERMDRWGTRWRVDLVLERTGRRAAVRTVWLTPEQGGPPRLVSCYPLGKGE
jgi:hypothetical protein